MNEGETRAEYIDPALRKQSQNVSCEDVTQTCLLALVLSLLAEVSSFAAMALANSETTLFRILFGFHRPGVEAAGFLIPELQEDDPNISAFESAVVWAIFVSTASIQWFIISLAGIIAYLHFTESRCEKIVAA